MTPIIRVQDLHRIYRVGDSDVHAVNGVTLAVQPGVMTAIVGRSGSGKTTLLNLIAGLEQPTRGEVWFDGARLDQMNEGQRLKLRAERISFVFQAFGLLPLLSAAENVSVPLRMRHMPRAEREARVTQALNRVGLLKRANHRPYEMSGGEQQRVAVARALAAGSDVILADEPTGQLDSATGRRILSLFRELITENGLTLLVVTHDSQVMEEADVVHEMRDGHLLDTAEQVT